MTLAAVGNTDTRDVSSRFTDPDGDTLNYTARSSAHRVATIGVSGSVVTVTAVAAGRATITVTATDNDPTNPLTAMQTFSVTVSAPATGFAPANQAAFNAALVGKQIMSGDYFFSFSPPNSLSLLEVSTSTTYSGSYTYTNTGSNMGRIVANYDDGRCTYNITYVSATTGTATTICNDEAATSGTWRIVDTMATGGDGPGLARAGECQVGGTYRPGESCDVYGIGSSTKRPFQVLSSGTGRFGFSISGDSINFRNATINGVLYYLVASNQGGGVWRIDEYRSS